MIRTMNQRLQDGIREIEAIKEKVGLDYPGMVNAIVIDAHTRVQNWDLLTTIGDETEIDEIALMKMPLEQTESILYHIACSMYYDSMKFNESMFTEQRKALITYYEEREEYEICAKLIKVKYDDVDYYAPPYETFKTKR